MELQHFRCFIVLAEELNFTRAADRLYLSQPYLTRLIGQIEKELGVTLLHRTTRKVILTDAGEKFLTEAQAAIARVEEAIQTMRRFAVHNQQRLRIGFTEMARYCVVPKILSVFRDRYPHVELEIVEDCTEELVEALDKTEIDLAFLHPPLRADFLNLIFIEQEPFAIALSSEHPLASQTKISLADLANDTFILHPREHGPVLYDRIQQLCQQAGFSPKILHQDTDKSFLALVTAEIGICLITPSMQTTKNPGIICLSIVGEAPILDHAVAWRQNDTRASITSFLQVVQEKKSEVKN